MVLERKPRLALLSLSLVKEESWGLITLEGRGLPEILPLLAGNSPKNFCSWALGEITLGFLVLSLYVS